MTRDLHPTTADLWRLVERYGSIAHAANAIGVPKEQLDSWLKGTAAIPAEYYDALLTLVGKGKEDK